MSNTTYTIQMASKISGVGVHTIRAWEKRYQALVPIRDDSGHRVYSKADIEKLMLLSELCLLGYTISKVAKLSTLELKKLLLDLGKTEESIEDVNYNLIKEIPSMNPTDSLPILSFALKNYKLDVITQELGKLKSSLSARDFALEIIFPLGVELFHLVSSGRFNSHQENAVRGLLKFHIGHNLFRPMEKKERGHVNVVVGGIEGETNDIALSCVGLLCQHYGYNFTYVGTGLSAESLIDEVRFLGADLAILGSNSGHLPLGKTFFQNYINKILGQIPVTSKVVVVGSTGQNLEINGDKRLRFFETIDAVDEFLSVKNH